MSTISKQQLWAVYNHQNPHWEEKGQITFTMAGLEKFFNMTYDLAEARGAATASSASSGQQGPFSDWWKNFVNDGLHNDDFDITS